MQVVRLVIRVQLEAALSLRPDVEMAWGTFGEAMLRVVFGGMLKLLHVKPAMGAGAAPPVSGVE